MDFYIYYIVIISFLLFFDYVYKDKQYSYLTIIAVGIVILISGFRYEVGYDFNSYQYYYLNMDEAVDKLEPGFYMIMYILKYLNFPAQALYIFCSCATVLLVFSGITKYSTNVRLSFLIYILIPGLYLNSFSIVRQALSIAILFYGYKYLLNTQYFRYFVIVLIASSIHLTTILTVPLFLLSLKLYRNAVGISLIGIPLSLLCGYMNIQDFIFTILLGKTKFVIYSLGEERSISFFKLLVTNLVYLFYLCFYRKMSELEKKILILLFFATIFVNMFSTLAFATRFSYYFRIFEVILVVNIIAKFKNVIGKTIMTFCFLIYFFAMFFNSLSYDLKIDEYPKMTPYRSILNN